MVQKPNFEWNPIRKNLPVSNLGSEVAMQLDLHNQSIDMGIGYQENLGLLHGSEAVSYTHLDVYKRQIQVAYIGSRFSSNIKVLLRNYF